jgi:hypothetical protein
MAKWTILDEFHLTVRIPANLSKTSQIVRTLNSKQFQIRLNAAIRQIFRSHPSLKPAKVTISR